MQGEADFRRAPQPLPPYVPQSRRPAVEHAGGMLPPWTSAQRHLERSDRLVEQPAPEERVAPDGAALGAGSAAGDTRAEGTPAWLEAAAGAVEEPQPASEAPQAAAMEPWAEAAAPEAQEPDDLLLAEEPLDQTSATPEGEDWAELFEVETYLTAEAAADLEAYLSEGASQAEATASHVDSAEIGDESTGVDQISAAEPTQAPEDVQEAPLWEPDFGDEAEPHEATRDEPLLEAETETSLETHPAWTPVGAIVEESDTADVETAEEAGAPLDTWPGEAEAWDAVAATGGETVTSASPMDSLAGRLEDFAARLRREGEAALDRAFTGDRLEAALAALIAGHRAASRE